MGICCLAFKMTKNQGFLGVFSQKIYSRNMIKRLRRHHQFMWSYSRALVQSFTRPIVIYLFFFSSTLIFVASGLFYFLEKDSNPGLGTFVDALYFVVATMTTVGYGDVTPHSLTGKILTIFLMLIGAALFVSYTAVLSTSMIEIEQEQSEKSAE